MIDTPVTPRLEELLEHAGWLRRLAARLVAGPHDADDLVQEVWRATLASERTDVRSPRAWLSGALRNVIKMRARGEVRRTAREQARELGVEVPSTAELAGEQELRRQLLEHVEALPDNERDVVLLRFYKDLPPRDVATELSIPVNTVRSRTARALQRLRERLDDQHGDRRTWSLALVPLLDPRGLQAVGIGEVTRRSRSLLISAAAATVAIGGYLGYESWTAREIVDLARTTPANEALDRFAATQDAAQQPTADRQEVVTAPPRFAGKVVDLEGRAIEGALVHFSARWEFDRLVEERKIRAEDWSRETNDDGTFSFARSEVVRRRGTIKLGAVAHPDYEAELGWTTWDDDETPLLRMRRAFDATVEVEVVERGTGQPVRFAAHCQAHWGEPTDSGTLSNNDPKLRSLSSDRESRIGGVVRLSARVVAGAENRLVIGVPGGDGRRIDLEVPDAHGHVYRFREEVTLDEATNDPTVAVLRGTVTDTVTGKPIHGARIRRVHVETEGRTTRHSYNTTQTRTSGSYSLGYDADSEAETLQFEHPDYLEVERSWSGDAVVDVKLQRKPSLIVRVLDDGRPLADLPLMLAYDREQRRAQTDKDGRVDFGAVARLSAWILVLPAKRASDDHALTRRSVTLKPGEPRELVIEMRVPDRLSVFGNVARVKDSQAVIAPTFVPLDDGFGWVPARRIGQSGYEAGDMRRGSYLVFLSPTDDGFRDGLFAFGGVLDLTGSVTQVFDTVVPTGRVQGRLVGRASWQGLHVVAVPELPRRSAAVNEFLGSKKLAGLLGVAVAAGGFFSLEHVADGPFVLEVRRGANVVASRRIEVAAGFATVDDWQVEG